MPPQAPSPASAVLSLTGQLETPLGDDRSYEHFVMGNQLEVLLAQDTTTDRAGAAIVSGVGTFSDDPDMLGTAHAAEHLRHHGSKKYPDENEYIKYLKKHSGSRNADAKNTFTIYHFEINAHGLHGALDRLAQFFIDPTFKSSAVDRELHNIDSEHRNDGSSDGLRVWQVEKLMSNPNHPWSNLEGGNLDTLKTGPEARGLNVREKLLDFVRKHDSANRMKLTVLGQEPLEVMKSWVVELFGGIVNLDLSENRWDSEGPLRPEDLGTQCFVKLITDLNWVDLGFQYLNETSMRGRQPSSYLSHLFCHKAAGSIFSCLKSEGASGIDTAIYPTGPDSPWIFLLRIHLTTEGVRKYREVVKVFFSYIALLRSAQPQEWIFNELVKLADYHFKFKEKSSATTFTMQTSQHMQSSLPKKWLLSGNRPRNFDGALIEQALACFRPDNCNITVASQSFPGDWEHKEKWFGTEYKSGKIPADLLAEFDQAIKTLLPKLHLPRENEFIPRNLEAVLTEEEPAPEPRLIRNDLGARVWYKKGLPGYKKGFQAPRAYLTIHCRNPFAHVTAKSFVMVRLYAKLVDDAIEECFHNVCLAGIRYSVQGRSTGIKIELSGYVETLPVALDRLLKSMIALAVQQRFKAVKELISRHLESYATLESYKQVQWLATWLERENWYTHKQMLAELQALNSTDMEEFIPRLLGQMHIEILIGGGICQKDALELSSMVETILKPAPLPQAQWPIVARSLAFPPGSELVYHQTLIHSKILDNAIDYRLYTGPRFDGPARAKTFLLEQMTHTPAFNQLRTQEKLGYVIFIKGGETATNMSYSIIIQGRSAPMYLEERIDDFLTGFADSLRSMPDSEFELHKSSLARERWGKSNSKDLKEEADHVWSHIKTGHLDFTLEEHDAEAIGRLTKDDMVNFYLQKILPSSSARSKLSVHFETKSPIENQIEGTIAVERMDSLALDGKKDGDGDEAGISARQATPIINVEDFKSTMKVMEAPQPVKGIEKFEDLDAKVK